MSETISWLHLTDLHYGQSHEWLWPRMRQQFKDDLGKLVERAGPWDVVFFSGDFVQRGTVAEYSAFTEEIVKLWDHLATFGPKPVFVGVPGNHDVERPNGTDPVVRQFFRWHEPSEESVRDEFWNDENCSYRTTLVRALSNYSEWLQALPIPQPVLKTGLLPGDFSAIVPIRNLKLGVVGLNTTYLQLGGGNYESKLDVHVRQLHAVCENDPDIWRRSLDMAVLMTHQPPSWLHPDALEQLNEICAPERFHAHICGHLHEPRMRDVREAGGPTRRLRQGPSLFGLEKWGPNEKERILFGYNLGKWDLDGFDGNETLWPRLANRTHDGMRILGPDVNLHLTIDNSVVTPFRTARPPRNETDQTVCPTSSTAPPHRAVAINSVATEEQRIVVIERPVDPENVRQKLKGVPRFRFKAGNQHRVVRTEEQAKLIKTLNDQKIAWIISDWAYGKDGFLASALEQFENIDGVVDIFHLQCGGVEHCEDLQAATETQLGLSFQEFLAAAAALPSVVLILDDLPPVVIDGAERAIFERIVVKPVTDFCPELRLVFIARHEPPDTNTEQIVRLRPFDVHETRSYIQHGPVREPELDDADVLDRVHKISGGLPMQLDKLLEDLSFSTVAEILEEDTELSFAKPATSEPVPHALQHAVAQLSNAESEQSRMSFRLLKVLTVLRDGEIFQSIKRFYPRDPFYPQNVSELANEGLLQVIPILQTASDLTSYGGRHPLPSTEAAKLLRVPRQVRDYVTTLISDEERTEIIRTSTDLLFGQDWWRGKIRLRNALFNSYSLSAMIGPGNEHVIAKHLLADALQKNNRHQIQRTIRLGLGLCQRLLSIDRYRDAMIACGAMVFLLKQTGYRKDYVEALRLHSRALRMVDRHTDAITAALTALDEGTSLDDETKGSIHLTLALAYNQLDKHEDALTAANSVLDLVHADSSDGHQARSIITERSFLGSARNTQLKEIEQSARNRGHVTAANNIALDLVHYNADQDDTLILLDRVIRSAKDNYNRTRAVIEKATVLNARRSTVELTDNDRRLLSAAYSYSYSQRIGKMLDRCHSVLWTMLKRENAWAPLLRLFRFSSLIWRLMDNEDQDSRYLRELDTLNVNQFAQTQRAVLHIEIHYLERRREGRPAILEV